MKNKKLEQALKYAEEGFYIFPLRPNEKKPIEKGGFHNATTYKDVISAWWRTYPEANIGIATGKSGLVVIDIDIKEDGNGFDSLDSAGFNLPNTLTSTTGSGGKHLIFNDDIGFRSSTNILPKVDTRAEGGYIVAPPSVVNGRPYQFDNAPSVLRDAIIDASELDDRLTILMQGLKVGQNGTNSVFYGNRTEVEKIPYDEAIAIMARYVEHDKKNLENYNNAISAICVLAKSVQSGEIGEEAARECVVILAMGNPDWETGNLLKLANEIRNPNLKTVYSFKRKFKDLFNKESQTMQDLKARLWEEGEEWRIEHTEIKENGTIKGPPVMHPAAVASILRKYAYFALIGHHADTSLLHIYNFDTGLYDASETLLFNLITNIEPRMNPPQWKHVMGQLKVKSRIVEPLQDKTLIPVNNGVFDTAEMTLKPFSYKYIITSKIATNYNPNACNARWFDVDGWINSLACEDAEISTLLWQVVNEAINPNHTRKKMGFLIGDGNNGKGTFQALLINLIGQGNVSALKPHDFKGTDGTRFKLSSLIGKVCNIGDDVSNAYIDDCSNLMSITTGDTVQVEIKNGGNYEMTFKTFCLFSGNDMPKMRNKSHGLYRRLLIIPFNADFNGEVENPLIKEEYIKSPIVLEYVLKKALEMKFDKFIEPKAVVTKIEDYKKENDYIKAYIEDVYIDEGYHLLNKVPISFVKADLLDFVRSNGNGTAIPYHWTKGFIETLNNLTENEDVYLITMARFNADEINNMDISNPIRVHANLTKAVRSIVKE